MLEYIKKLITPDMVSFWLPSGQNRAIDLIRGNHGQCYGTHPNVPVLPNLINPSLGWSFDGTDDYVQADLQPQFETNRLTFGAWVYLRGLGTLGSGTSHNFLTIKNAHDYFFLGHNHDTMKLAGEASFTGPTSKFVNGDTALSLNKWYFVVMTYDGSDLKCYLNGVEEGSTSVSKTLLPAIYPTYIGCLKYFGGIIRLIDGYVVVPFIDNQAWSIAKINNFYLATKGLFAPRG